MLILEELGFTRGHRRISEIDRKEDELFVTTPDTNKQETIKETKSTGYSITTTKGTASWASAGAGTQTIAHGLGVIPNMVRIHYTSVASDGTGSTGAGVYENSVMNINGLVFRSSAETVVINSTSYIIYFYRFNTALDSSATIAVDATNITLTWSGAGSPTFTNGFNWEATAYTLITT